MRNFLVGAGYEVLQAENGEDGLKQLKEARVDFFISDIYMPVMDGIRFHREVRAIAEYATTPFLFVSAFDDQHSLDAVKDPRYDGFLRKANLVNELKEWLTFLSSPVEKRPKLPPGGARSRLNQQLRGGRT